MSNAVFQVKLPAGRYRAFVLFEPLGYWGGEAAQFTKRTLRGRYWNVAEEAGQWGKLDFVYHFQDVEPLPGADLWRTYLQSLFHPAQADVILPDGQFDLRVDTDGVNAKRAGSSYPRMTRARPGHKFLPARRVPGPRRRAAAAEDREPRAGH
jgi:hypothetical protein